MRKNNLVWFLLILTPLWLVFSIFIGQSGFGIPDWNTTTGRAILLLRLNRTIAGFMVGAGLSCSGVVLQALLRNPLADPYILGVSSGAALGAALAIFTGVSAAGFLILPMSAFIAGVATLTIVYFIARQGSSADSVYGLLLSGVIVSSICASLLMLIISLVPVEGLHSITWWMLGNLQILSFQPLLISSALIALSFVGIWLIARQLNALTLGHEMAHHLGVRTGMMVKTGLALATLATAASVGIAGLIGFVGLIVPHIMRNIIGPDHRRLVPASALAGGLFLTLCDSIGRVVFAPVEIPVGVITALIGGPFFLILLSKRRKSGWME